MEYTERLVILYLSSFPKSLIHTRPFWISKYLGLKKGDFKSATRQWDILAVCHAFMEPSGKGITVVSFLLGSQKKGFLFAL